jgi:DNA topoisomerase I
MGGVQGPRSRGPAAASAVARTAASPAPAEASRARARRGTAEPAARFDDAAGQTSPIAARPAGGSDVAKLRAASEGDGGAFTADGERKWKVPPPGVEVTANDTGRGAWIEKWRSPTTGAWVHNYTQAYMEARAEKKFVDNRRFGEVVGDIRKAVAKDLTRDNTKAQLSALCVALIDQAYFRVGNETSEGNGVYGVTTLQAKHVQLGDDGRVSFEYVGKARVEQHRVVVDKQIAKILKRLKAQRGPDERLFRFKNDAIDAGDVNRYLSQFGVTAKQFRTFHATRLMHEMLASNPGLAEDERPAAVSAAFERVAAKLGHTPEVCRGSYVDPTLIEDFLAGKELTSP